MGMPAGIGIIDTLVGFAHPDVKAAYRWVTRQTRDPEELASPVEFLFKDVPDKRMGAVKDRVGATLEEMDRWGIERGMVGVAEPGDDGDDALRRYPDRFIASTGCDPNQGAGAIATLVRAYETPVHNYVLRLTGDRTLAEDLTQDVFLRVLNGLPKFSSRCKFTTWLFQITKNRVLDEL